MEKMTIETAVARAALYLDRHCPNWYEKVDLDALDMMDSRYCISGQVKGDRTWEETGQAFCEELGIRYEDEPGAFSTGEELWREQIELRLPLPTATRKLVIQYQKHLNLDEIQYQIDTGKTSGPDWSFED